MRLRICRLSVTTFLFLSLLIVSHASAQLPPPGYNSHWRTADGTEKLALEFGGGWDIATGPTRATQTRGWNYIMGGGYNFNRHLALFGEYSFNRFTVPPIVAPTQAEQDFVPIGGVHIWSLTANPKFQYHATERTGAYLIAGGGLYHKVIQPGATCATGSCAYTVANAGGASFGTGIALKPSENSNAKFYAEVRYVWIATKSQENFTDPSLNSNTSYIPITAGIRW